MMSPAHRVGVCATALLLAACAVPPLARGADALPIDGRESLNAVLWMQTAHEYAFSTAMVYAMATRALAQAASLPSALADPDAPAPTPDLPPAIVLDLDETVLSTSRYGAGLVANGHRHTEAAWAGWVVSTPAELLPGALDFLRAARNRGYRIFYVTNRACPDAGRPAVYPHPACPQRDATVAEARRLGLPQAEDPRAFLLRNDQDGWQSSDKSPRRRFLSGSHKVVMLLGDDLGDFLPRGQVKALRESRPAKHLAGSADDSPPAWSQRFGTQWFLLPNPSYGSWEVALADCDSPDRQDRECYEARLRGKYDRLMPVMPAPPPVPTPSR